MKDISPWHIRRVAEAEERTPEFIYTSATETDEVHLRDYWKILVKRSRLVVYVLLIALAIGAYVNITATPLYTAQATLKIEPHMPAVTGLGALLSNSEFLTGQYDYYQTQFKLLESRNLAAKVIRDLGLESDRAFTDAKVISPNVVKRIKSWTLGNLEFGIRRIAAIFQEKPKNVEHALKPNNKIDQPKIEIAERKNDVKPWLIGRYLGFLDVQPVKNTRLVELRFTTPDPDFSQQLANAHARGFIQMNLENRFELTNEAREFLDQKNAELKAKLEKSEDALNRYRQKHGVVSMDKGENIVVDRLVELNKQLTTARAQRIETESLYRVVENKSTEYVSQLVNQGLVPTLRSNLLGLEAEKVKLSTVFKPDHPRMMEINRQISEVKLALNTEIKNVVRGIQDSYIAARAREQALQAEAQKQQQAALSLKELGVEYAVLQEEVNVNRSLYETVLKRLNETNVSNDLAVSNMQITQRAEKPLGPSSPDISFNILLVSAFGLFIGVGLALFLEYMDSTVSTPERVWRATALSTLGVVPDLRSIKRRFLLGSEADFPLRFLLRRVPGFKPATGHSRSKDLIFFHHPLSVVAESYRTIRTALLFSLAEKPPQVILLTSPCPQEGKTVSTLNLGISLALDGYTVLVIDADMRKGSCHRRLGLKNNRGLSNILTGHLQLEEGIQKTRVNGLSLMTRGVLPPNPTDLLESAKMMNILGTLRDSFNFILIDSPPVVAISDATVLSSRCDGVLLVVNATQTTMASARQAIDRLGAGRAKLLGVLLNGIDINSPDYGYYRYYYSSYYNASDREKAEDVTSDTAGNPRVNLPESAIMNDDLEEPAVVTGTATRRFFDHLVHELTLAMGPMAPLVVRDQVAVLGATSETFPANELGRLVKELSREILNEELKVRFQNSMFEEIRTLHTTSDGLNAAFPE